jgi:hypothetical protein
MGFAAPYLLHHFACFKVVNPQKSIQAHSNKIRERLVALNILHRSSETFVLGNLPLHPQINVAHIPNAVNHNDLTGGKKKEKEEKKRKEKKRKESKAVH